MSYPYANLVQREQDLFGNVEIIWDVVYWPMRVGAVEPPTLPPTHAQILRFIAAGYRERTVLGRRLQAMNAFDVQLDELITHGWVASEVSDGAVLLSLTDGPTSSPKTSDLSGPFSVQDAVSDSLLTLPEGAVLLLPDAREPSYPVLVVEGLDATAPDLRYLECLLMILHNPRTIARSVRVYSQEHEIPALQEILYDLVLDQSRRLANTNLLPSDTPQLSSTLPQPPMLLPEPVPATPIDFGEELVRRQADVEALSGELDILSNLNETQDAEIVRLKQENEVLRQPQQEPLPTALPKNALLEVLRGEQPHVQVLYEALRQSQRQIVLVTPFARARLADALFRKCLFGALERGVKVTVIHGMAGKRKEDIENEDKEEERITDLYRSMNKHRDRLEFIRVTDLGNTSTGEHSKILICDCDWAVVTSFNWFSFPENSDTGLRTEQPEVVADLLRFFHEYLKPSLAMAGNPVMSNRAWNEHLYGEFNSK